MVAFRKRGGREEGAGRGRQEPCTNQEGVGVSLSNWSLWKELSLGAWGRPLAPETPARKFVRPCVVSHAVLVSQWSADAHQILPALTSASSLLPCPLLAHQAIAQAPPASHPWLLLISLAGTEEHSLWA